MLELPKNFVMHQCRDVEIYREFALLPGAGAQDKIQKLGEYCLVEK